LFQSCWTFLHTNVKEKASMLGLEWDTLWTHCEQRMLTMLLVMKERRCFFFFCSTFFWSSKSWKGVCGWENNVENIKVGKIKPSLFSSKNALFFLCKIMVCFDYMLFIYKNTLANKEHGMLNWCLNQNQFPKSVIN
jgi:hypothetical protein